MSRVRLPLDAAARLTQTGNNTTCFYEANPSLPLLRRGLVEGVGTLLLMFIVTASAMLPSLQPPANEARMLGSALIVPAALVSLVWRLAPCPGDISTR